MTSEEKSLGDYLKQDSDQILRMRRMGMALAGAVLLSVICIIFKQEGIFRVSTGELQSLLISFWTINILFFLTIVTGLNKKFKDPSMTMAQVLWSISSTMVAIYYTNDLRSSLLMLCLLSLLFGSLRLTGNQLIFAVFYSITCYIFVIYLLINTPNAVLHLQRELLSLFTYCLVSIGYAMLAFELMGFRKYMKMRSHNLNTSLQEIKQKSTVDELTGAGNQRFILDLLERQRAMAARTAQYYFCTFMINIDDFDKINATFGQEVGNKVLQEVCNIMQKTLRNVDYFGRINEDKFLVIESFTNAAQGQISAERIRAAISKTDFSLIAPNLKITISVGNTLYNAPESTEDLLKRTESALYLAQKKGRDCVVTL